MGNVSKDEIEAAKQVDVLGYLQRHEPHNLKRIGADAYCLRDHDSFVIYKGKWFWNSRGYGCKTGTALNYLICVRGYEFTDAVRTLLNDVPFIARPAHVRPKSQSTTKQFKLPPRNSDHRRVTAYLRSRGIDRELILNCIKAGLLYEDAKYHNCVFTGRNEEGRTRFACVRSTTGPYKGDVDGSDKRYGFILPPNDPASRNIACFEAPIDVLSHKTMSMKGFDGWDGWRLTLGGGSTLALRHFLEHHPAVDTVYICTDADKAGQRTADRIRALTAEDGSPFRHVAVKPHPPPFGNDYNDSLLAFLKEERTQGRPAKTNLNERGV